MKQVNIVHGIRKGICDFAGSLQDSSLAYSNRRQRKEANEVEGQANRERDCDTDDDPGKKVGTDVIAAAVATVATSDGSASKEAE